MEARVMARRSTSRGRRRKMGKRDLLLLVLFVCVEATFLKNSRVWRFRFSFFGSIKIQ
jgi:hypothetical protein